MRLASALAALGVACLTVALVWPGLAGRLLLGLVLALAMAGVGARAYRAGLPATMSSDGYTPFDGVSLRSGPSPSPAVIESLAAQLRAVETPAQAAVVPVPSAARRILEAEVGRRLAEHHGLDPDDVRSHGRIRALVSEATWELIRPDGTGVRSLALRPPVPIRHLAEILEDAERL